jgi:hypothetical protein
MAIRQALIVSTDIGTWRRMSWTARPPVPQRTAARQIWSSPRWAAREDDPGDDPEEDRDDETDEDTAMLRR